MVDYMGRLPELIVSAQVPGSLKMLDKADRKSVEDLVISILTAHFPKTVFLPYVFIDRGTFEKELKFVDNETGESWAIGQTSESVIIYAFTRQRANLDSGRLLQAKRELLDLLRGYNKAARICA
jgi:hypothetical protein